jgi:2-dehydro-3-deoxyphosphooctonate aldolase (KDO 8-P synthase)
VNVKKGQFMAPDDMRRVVDKIRAAGNDRVTVTERGASFGYHNLVVDMRSFAWMQSDGIAVIYDVTHSLQLPGGLGHSTGGSREFHPYLARAAAAAGVDGFFVEVHASPRDALSDPSTQLTVEEFDLLVGQLEAVVAAVREGAP